MLQLYPELGHPEHYDYIKHHTTYLPLTITLCLILHNLPQENKWENHSTSLPECDECAALQKM